MTVANIKKLAGGPKALAVEHGSFQFSTTTTTAEVGTNLKVIVHAQFTPVPGLTAGTAGGEHIYIKETVTGTATSEVGTAYYTGGIHVSGTSVTVDRVPIPKLDGSGFGTTNAAISGLWVNYKFEGVN